MRAAEWLEKAPAMPLLLITRGAQVKPPTHQAPSCTVEQKTQPAVPCAQGTVAYRPGKPKIAVALDPVVVSDTVGAGDSYMGAFLVSLREKGALEKGVLAKMVRPNPFLQSMFRAISGTRFCAGRGTSRWRRRWRSRRRWRR